MIRHYNLAGCTSVSTGVNWTTANEHCGTQNDSLVDILDVQNHFSYFNGLYPIWSPAKGHFTPWIAYKGCFHDENLCWSATKKQFITTTSCHILNSNTVGNCYFECKAKILQMGVVQTRYSFSLVSRGQFAYVCAITISCKLYLKVLNATFCVGDLLIMAYVVDIPVTTLACMNPQLLCYLTHTLEDSV